MSQLIAAEDALAEDLPSRIYAGRPRAPIERQYLRHKLAVVPSPTGEHVPAPLWGMPSMERLNLAAFLGVLDRAAQGQ